MVAAESPWPRALVSHHCASVVAISSTIRRFDGKAFGVTIRRCVVRVRVVHRSLFLAFMTNGEHTDNAQGATRDAETQAAKVEKMFEYGYRKSITARTNS